MHATIHFFLAFSLKLHSIYNGYNKITHTPFLVDRNDGIHIFHWICERNDFQPTSYYWFSIECTCTFRLMCACVYSNRLKYAMCVFFVSILFLAFILANEIRIWAISNYAVYARIQSENQFQLNESICADYFISFFIWFHEM